MSHATAQPISVPKFNPIRDNHDLNFPVLPVLRTLPKLLVLRPPVLLTLLKLSKEGAVRRGTDEDIEDARETEANEETDLRLDESLAKGRGGSCSGFDWGFMLPRAKGPDMNGREDIGDDLRCRNLPMPPVLFFFISEDLLTTDGVFISSSIITSSWVQISVLSTSSSSMSQ